MKLIVDVSKSDYEVIINHCDDYVKSLYNEPEERCILAVKNGTPLDDLRAEIEQRKQKSGGEPNRDLAFSVCLQIVDKYRSEVSS